MSSNNATKKLIGFDFQKLIALELLFDGKPNSTIYLECYGDVSDGSQSIEIKHHQGNVYLSDRSIDFWKTLNNLIIDFNTYQHFSDFILHTTASISEGSVFENWRNCNSKQRLQLVRSIPSNATIKNFHDTVANTPDKILLYILERLAINSNQLTIDGQLQKLMQHTIFKAIKPESVRSVIERLHGNISLLAIENLDNWHITQDGFLEIFRSECRNYMIEELLFPITSKHTIDTEKAKADYHFCTELKAISFEPMLDGAIMNYLRASSSFLKMLEERPNLDETLDAFDDRLKDEMEFNKGLQLSRIREQTGNVDKRIHSRNLFTECMRNPALTIRGVVDVQPYYPKGRMHQIIEDKQFSWIFED